MKSTTEQNPKNIILHCGTSDINDKVEPLHIAEEIVELANSIKKYCSSNVTVSYIVPRYGKLNEQVKSANRLLRIYCRTTDIRFVARENINPSKRLNCSVLHVYHFGEPILTVTFLNVLNSLDSEQQLKSKGSYNYDKKSSQSETLNEIKFLCFKNLLKTYFLGI